MSVREGLDAVVLPERAIFSFLTRTSGPDGADDTDMITVSGTGTPAPSVFEYTAGNGRNSYISRLNIMFQDGSITPDKWGGISALTNGCKIEAIDPSGAVVLDFGDGRTFKTNSHLAYLAGSDIREVDGTSIDALPVRWTVAKAFQSRPLWLPGGYKLRWTNQDSMTGLSEFRVMVQGWWELDDPHPG